MPGAGQHTGAVAATPAPAGLRRRAAAALAIAGAAVVWALAALPFAGPLPVLVGCALCCCGAMLVLDRIDVHHPHPRFGLANAVTLARGGGATVLAALAVEPEMLDGPAAWAALSGAASLLALDGLDGWAARRQRLASAFGARFDMEVDALLILALAALAAGLGKVGTWVLALGLIRYGFVLAGWLVPRLARPLPPSRRRRVVCALQVAALALLLAPPVQPPWSGRLAAFAFAALVWSFAIDVRRLLRRAA